MERKQYSYLVSLYHCQWRLRWNIKVGNFKVCRTNGGECGTRRPLSFFFADLSPVFVVGLQWNRTYDERMSRMKRWFGFVFFLRFAENRKRSANGFGLKDATRKAARREEALGAPYPAERGRLLFFLFVFFSSTNIQILIQWFAFPATPQRRRRRLGQTKPKPKHGEKNSMCIQINVFITSKRLWRDIQGCGDS